MAYTLRELGSPELASMYKEYLRLSEMLEKNEIDPIVALHKVEALEVVDNYDARWKIDPSSATLMMIDSNGVRTTNADPRMFQPADPDQADFGPIPEYQYEPDLAEEPISYTRRKMVWWKKVLLVLGALVTLAGVFLAGIITHNQLTPDPVEVPVEDPRPVIEGDGPSAERIQVVFDQLSSGDVNRVKFVVPGETSDDMLRWASTVFGSMRDSGYRFSEERTAEGVSVLKVLDKSDRVIMQGDLTWSEDAGGTWVLDEVPLMSPVDTEVDQVPVETNTPEPEEGEEEESTEDDQ